MPIPKPGSDEEVLRGRASDLQPRWQKFKTRALCAEEALGLRRHDAPFHLIAIAMDS
jgi:hypothetical protein